MLAWLQAAQHVQWLSNPSLQGTDQILFPRSNLTKYYFPKTYPKVQYATNTYSWFCIPLVFTINSTFLMGIHINGFVIIGDLVAAHCHKVPAFQTSTVSNQKEGEKRCCDKVETYHKLCTRANNRIISL